MIREPAGQADLKLAAEQRRQLKKINEQIYGPLLALRNWRGEKVETEISELLSLSRQRFETVFDNEQKELECVWKFDVAKCLLDRQEGLHPILVVW